MRRILKIFALAAAVFMCCTAYSCGNGQVASGGEGSFASSPNVSSASGGQASGSQNSDSEADSASSPVSSAAHTHAYGAWYVYREAACTEAGEERRDCACGEYDTRVIPALGHNYGEWRATKEASCTEDGERERECSRCRETETEKIEKLGHDYVDGICTRCQEVNPDKIYTEGSVKADAVYGIGGEDGWTLDKAAGVYTSRTEEAAILMFKNLEFEGGVIEWDMNVPTDTYKHNTTCGLLFASPNQRVISSEETDSYYVFGRAFTGEFVGYCKRNGEFFWEDGAKLSPPLITCTAGVTYRFRLEWDNVNRILSLTFDGNTVSFQPQRESSGKYIGLYSEVKGTAFSNITVTPKTYVYAGVTVCNGTQWEFSKTGENVSYKALSDCAVLTFKDLSFTTGTLEWDMMVPSDDNYAFGTLCGVIWGASTEKVDIHSSLYYVSGRYAGGIFVTFAKFLNGDGSVGFDWENAQQIQNGETMAKGLTVHYTLAYDGTEFTLRVGTEEAKVVPVHQLAGGVLGLYSEVAGTVFSNIRLTASD